MVYNPRHKRVRSETCASCKQKLTRVFTTIVVCEECVEKEAEAR